WPIGHGSSNRRAIAVHVSVASIFPIVHIGLLAALQGLLGMDPARADLLVMYYYLRGLVHYTLAASVMHAINASRLARDQSVATAELQASLVEARLSTLRAQLSPHFLFNVLNAIAMLV